MSQVKGVFCCLYAIIFKKIQPEHVSFLVSELHV